MREKQTVLNTKNVPVEERIMFLGQPLGIQRYDQQKYPIFYDLFIKQETFRWMPDRIDLTKDRVDYEKMTDTERHIFDSNIRWQTMTDSLLSRSIHNVSQYITNPELEICCGSWASFETIHSLSYTHIFKNITKNAVQFFDSILEDPQIQKRAVEVKNAYDQLFGDSDDLRQVIFDAILNTQGVEGVSFYASFICSFYFGYNEKMTGSSDIIKEISRDENLHQAITMNIMKNWRNNPEEMFQDIVSRNEEKVYEFYKLLVKQEADWADYLFCKGSLLGLNPDVLKNYVEWIANNRLAAMGYRKIFPTKINPTASWSTPYFDSTASQPAPQEKEITSYLSNALNMKVDASKLKRFL
jgi:ribonucleoside-diphosphate reductase beta chain